MLIGRRSGEAVMLVVMGVMMVGGIILWLTRGEFHMMPTHGREGAGNTHHKQHAGAKARHAEISQEGVAAPTDDGQEIDEKNGPEGKSSADPSSGGLKHWRPGPA